MKNKFVNNLSYSTDFKLLKNNDIEIDTDYSKTISITLNKHKNNKLITLISNIYCSESSLNEIAKELKIKCGTGGTVKNGDIIIQGDFIEKAYQIIKELGFNNIKKL